MIINMDDILYTAEKFCDIDDIYYMKKCQSVEDLIKQHDSYDLISWIVCVFVESILDSRIVEIEAIFECYSSVNTYLGFYHRGGYTWPEMEEMVRKDAYEKSWYEKETGLLI